MDTHMATEFFEKTPTLLRLEMFTVMNEGFQRWDPAPKSAEAKAFLVMRLKISATVPSRPKLLA